jgi:hypothetical protein
MAECPINVDLIYSDENIGDSLPKINNNFTTLLSGACDLEKRLDNRINIRTFFYYGPNSATEANSGMMDNQASRPSDTLIESFVNDSDKLNLKPISEAGDVAYVIYQKTGWHKQTDTYYRQGTGSVPFQRTVRVKVTRKIGIGGKGGGGTVTTWEPRIETYYVGYRWETNVIFVIYRLTYNSTQYVMDSGFPKYTRASTASTINWNNPQLWSTY